MAAVPPSLSCFACSQRQPCTRSQIKLTTGPCASSKINVDRRRGTFFLLIREGTGARASSKRYSRYGKYRFLPTDTRHMPYTFKRSVGRGPPRSAPYSATLCGDKRADLDLFQKYQTYQNQTSIRSECKQPYYLSPPRHFFRFQN